jgi:hypothetical protein
VSAEHGSASCVDLNEGDRLDSFSLESNGESSDASE